MISARNALFRQTQEFFHSHLLGIYRWDDVEHSRPQTIDRPEGVKERREQSWYRGKTHDKVEMRFGPFSLTVTGPFEDEKYPCGLISVQTGRLSLEGPLDSATWDRAASFIKEHRSEEVEHGIAARSDWGR